MSHAEAIDYLPLDAMMPPDAAALAAISDVG